MGPRRPARACLGRCWNWKALGSRRAPHRSGRRCARSRTPAEEMIQAGILWGCQLWAFVLFNQEPLARTIFREGARPERLYTPQLMAQVILENLSKVYPEKDGPGVEAVKRISLEIADREFMVLVGPSGCGKSTT